MKHFSGTMNRRVILLIVLAGLGAINGKAQDGQLSQYENAPIMLNPALTGMYENADFRMSANVRSQWNSLSSNFITTALGYEASFNKRFGVGAYLKNYNMAGIMNDFNFSITGAYNVSNEKARHTLSVGANLGLIYKKVNDQDLVWDMQYNDGYFDSDLPTGEDIQKGGRLMPELALGVAYRSIDPSKRFNLFGNFAMFHLTMPDESIFRETKSGLPIRYSGNAGVRIELMNDLYITPNALYWRQGQDQLINAGVLGEFKVPSSNYGFQLGASYRVDDAIIAQVGMRHRGAQYRFSYDISTSPLKTYTNNQSAFEFSVIYTGTHNGRARVVRGGTF